MAKQAKKTAGKKTSSKKAAGAASKAAPGTSRRAPADVEAALIEAAFRLAATVGWRHLTMHEIADEAGVPLSQALPAVPGKTALLRRFIRRIDREVLQAVEGSGGGDSPRDRLFDVMMARFDALAPYRDGLANVLKDTACDPMAALCLMPRSATSLAWMLEAADIPTTGLRGRLRIKGLGLVYADAMRVFLRDSSEDLAKTMARLDTGLSRAERAAGMLGWRPSAGAAAAAEA